MERHGARCTAQEFYSSLNVIFHEFESEAYDEVHAHMWKSIPAQFALFADDCLRAHPGMPESVRLLDIGCGTGLATECLFRTALAPRIQSVDLLDVSPAMLRRAEERISRHGVPVRPVQGMLDSLPPGSRYEFIVTCSVLHHIPDLPGFLRAVSALQADGGIFLHVHDQNGDYVQDAELRARSSMLTNAAVPEWALRFSPRRILGRLRRELAGPGRRDYALKTNRALLEKGLITTPLAADEIFAITDIQNYNGGHGISISNLKRWMTDYDCISQRSYGFFGRMSSALPRRYRSLEEDLIRQGALNGSKLGAAWKRRS